MLLTFIKRAIRYANVKNAVNNANKMAELRKRDMYVIQVFKKIRVYDREHINRLIESKILSSKLYDEKLLIKACIYTTHKK